MTSNKVQPLNGLNFDAVVSQAIVPVLVDFTAAWCGPCKLQSVILDRLAETADVLIAKVDVDESPDLASRFGVRGMPTLVAFQGGTEAGRRLGLTREQGILELLNGSSKAVVTRP